MKRLFLAFTLCLGLTFMASAQVVSTNDNISTEDYENYLEGKRQVEFRETVIKSMDLTEDQVIRFDPIYNEYANQKRALIDEKFELVEAYRAEMAEDDTAEDEDEETAGFIENYWEVTIKEMELRKDFFDRFEDVVTTNKAINFFLLEEDMENQMMRPSLVRVVPMIIEYDPMIKNKDKSKSYDKEKMDKMKMKKDKMKMKDSSSDSNSSYTESDEMKTEMTAKTAEMKEKTWAETEKEEEMTTSETETAETTTWTEKGTATTAMSKEDDTVKAFSTWVESTDKEVSLSHQYTSTGLTHLVDAIWTVAEKNNIDVSDWETKKEEILKVADKITVDKYSTKHADYSRKAFVMVSEMIDAIQNEAYTSEEAENIANAVSDAAQAIDPAELMTPQAEKIYTFFEHANKAVTAMSVPATTVQPDVDNKAYNNEK